MKKFAFITRHAATPEQDALANEQGITLIPVGDWDAFDQEGNFKKFKALLEEGFEGVVVVHPQLSLDAVAHMDVGIFKNSNRAPEGERPQFEAAAFHVTPWAGRWFV